AAGGEGFQGTTARQTCRRVAGPETGEGPGQTGPEAPPGEAPAGLPAVAGYELVSVLGRGGMGVVYLARQVRLKRLVALKMIRPRDDVGAERLARFRAEAEAAARLQHPNIVQVYEVGEDRGR